jgi:hypothetical protein
MHLGFNFIFDLELFGAFKKLHSGQINWLSKKIERIRSAIFIKRVYPFNEVDIF